MPSQPSVPSLTIREWFTKALDSPTTWAWGIIALLANPPGTPVVVPPVEPPPIEPPPVEPPPVEPPPVEPPPVEPPPVEPPVEPPPVVVPPVEPPPVIPPPPVSTERNAYFEALIQRPDFKVGYSLRPRAGAPKTSPYYERQLERPGLGGYAAGNSVPLSVTYDPAMDAAKVSMPPFVGFFGNPPLRLAAPMSADDQVMVVTDSNFDRASRRQFRLDDEIVTLVETAPPQVIGQPRTVKVSRGTFGTPVSAHAAATPVLASTNGLQNTVRLPLNLSGNHDWLITWDAWFSESWRRDISGIAGNKTFQIAGRRSATASGVGPWFEIKTRVDLAPDAESIGLVGLRGYSNPQGSNVSAQTTLAPMVGQFALRPKRRTRYWVLIEQRTEGWDRVSLWVADEHTDPVLLVDRLEFESHDLIGEFWLEFDDSQYFLGANRPEIVTHVVNVAVNETSNVAPLLIRPEKG